MASASILTPGGRPFVVKACGRQTPIAPISKQVYGPKTEGLDVENAVKGHTRQTIVAHPLAPPDLLGIAYRRRTDFTRGSKSPDKA